MRNNPRTLSLDFRWIWNRRWHLGLPADIVSIPKGQRPLLGLDHEPEIRRFQGAKMNSPEANELWRGIAGDIVKQLKGEPVRGKYRFLSQVQIAPKDGRFTFTVGAMISEADYRYRGMSDRRFWLTMQRGSHWGAEFKAAGLSLEFFPNEDGQSVETVTFWLTNEQ